MTSILLSPLRINSLEVKNRIVLPPITMNFAEDGAVSERDIAYHVARSRGGCGLNMVDGALVECCGYGFRLALDDDRFIEPLSRLAVAVHDTGGRIGIQLLHHGRCAPPGLEFTRERLVSVVPGLTSEDESLVMDERTIREMRDAFVRAGVRAKKAGMDMVELSAGHGYLLAQFMSPLTNRRTDGYGGSFENRMRFPLEVLSGLREALGGDYPISVRVSAEEMYPGGLELEDTKAICDVFVAHGVDMISVSASLRESYEYCMPPACVTPGWLAEKAGEIRRHIQTRVPVMVSGRILDCSMAENILEREYADLIGMGRALIADPNRVAAYVAGAERDCLPCLGCNVGCVDNLNQHRAISCTVNPLAGQEAHYPAYKAEKRLKIVIVGGGPAGMQAALSAAGLGHAVTLLEKRSELGGRLDVVSTPPFKDSYRVYRSCLARRVRSAGVTVRCGVEATADSICAFAPDAVILATGSIPLIPRFCLEADIVTAEDVLRDEKLAGRRVLVLGGGAVGAETAEALAEKGRQVSVIEMREQLAPDLEWRCRKFLEQRLHNLGVQLLLGSKITSIKGRTVTLENRAGELEVLDDADTIILAMGYHSRETMEQELLAAGVRVYRIGDCYTPGLVYAATHQALETVYQL